MWQVGPRSDGADHPAPAAKKLSVGLLVTALAHEQNLARNFDWIRFTANESFFPDSCS
jgi:hypothetical protein